MIDRSAGATKMVLAGAALLLAIACDANGPEGSSQLELSGPSESFGAVPVGGRGEVRRFTLTNEGDAPTGELLVRLAGADAGEFAIVRDDCSGQVLPVAGTCSIDLQLRPQTPGIKQAQLSVADDAGRAVSAALSGSGADGSGAGGGLVMQSSAYDFGDAGVSATGPTHGFIVRNLGPVTSGPVTVELAGPGSASYSIVGNTCAGAQLVVSGACLVTVRFQPATAGTIAGLLTASASPGGSATAVFTGVGGTAGTMTAEPAARDFGTQRVGVDQPSLGVVFRNSGASPTGVLDLRLAGTDASEFSVSNESCEGVRLAPGQQCTVTVAFAPQTSGAKSGVLEVSDVFGTFASAALTGMAEQVSLYFSRADVVFGELSVGDSNELGVSVTNGGDAASQPLSLAVEECTGYYGEVCAPATNYSLGATTCAGVALAPGASCTVALVYNPQQSGFHSGQLIVEEGGARLTLGLQGTSATTVLDVAPGSLAFPATQVGASSAAQVVTVTNSGTHPSEPVTLSIEVCGYYYCGTSPHFEVGANTCAGASLPAGASCTIPVIFRPQALGHLSADLRITGAGSPYGIDFAGLTGEAVAGP